MRVYLGSDHAGFELKAALVEHLPGLGYEPVDCGALTLDLDDDYPPPCFAAATRTIEDPGSLGIVIGGSGNGERAALVWSQDTARLARQHNDANVMSIGARNHPMDEALSLAETFLATPFSQDPRHQRRIGELTEYEQTGRV